MRLQLDHVTVCGSDLEAMRRAFREVELTTVYGGPHANGVTHMDLLAFVDGSYMELIAPLAAAGGASGMMSGWARLMEGDAGAGAWAVRSDDIHAEAARLRAAGIEVRGPEGGGRTRPDGSALEWETAVVGPGAAGSVLPFVIEDKTPRELRVPKASSSVGSLIRGVGVVVLGVRDLETSVGLFRRGYELEEPRAEAREDLGMTLAFFPGTPVMLASALKDDGWLADRIARFGECPAAFLLGTGHLDSVTERYRLGNADVWFGRRLAWFDESRLRGMRLGVIEALQTAKPSI
jgi:hypothetical protein